MENTNSLHEYLEFDDLQLSQMEPDELLKIIAMQAAIINQFGLFYRLKIQNHNYFFRQCY